MRFIFSVSAIFSLLLVLTGCSERASATLSVDPAMRPLLWPNVKLIGGVNVDRLVDSPLYQRHRTDLTPLWKRINAVQVGLDVEKDVHRITFASNGSDSVVLLTGKFNRQKILQQWKSQGAKETRIGAYPAAGRDGSALVFLSDRAVLGGLTGSVQSALAVQDSGKGEIPETIQSRLQGLPSKSQIYLVSQGGLPLQNLSMRSDTRTNLSNFLELISGVSMAVGADTGSHLQGTLQCASADGANRVNDALRGIIGLGRLSTKDNETDLLRIYDAIQITKEANAVRVKADLSASDTDRLWTILSRFSGRY